jgi:hypothetical protein
LTDFISQNKLNFVGDLGNNFFSIQNGFLETVDKNMHWKCVPAKGSAGGMLVGFKMDDFEIISWHAFEFCVVDVERNVIDKWVWRLVTVYGSPYEESKLDFLTELDGVLANWLGPTLIEGDLI